MAFGIGVNDGWYRLLDELCEDITFVIRGSGLKVVAEQIKEKFGTLRFYYRYEPQSNTKLPDNSSMVRIVDAIISRAEWRSGNTCEMCGEYGTTYHDGWVSTLCRKHKVDRMRKRVEGCIKSIGEHMVRVQKGQVSLQDKGLAEAHERLREYRAKLADEEAKLAGEQKSDGKAAKGR